ncbi:MAG TPA: bifunctional nicotinamidase/pyrazinamidase [candidate division Zixibacteria bacterium]|nr:bifunctional nicotinamidase/pyrazinamidase [candidate division Zixibacteria bacterium]
MPDAAEKDALVVVDLQNDFCPGGALGVAGGDKIIPIVNDYIKKFAARGLPVIATRDWHPEKTRHFAEYGGAWPPHCVQGTRGAEFHPELRLEGAIVVSKGMDPSEDSYSGFEACDAEGTPLPELLRRLGVERIFIVGLATDYCVRHTALDALRRGFKVVVLKNAVAGVNLKPGDSEEALAEMARAGAELRESL